MPAKAVHRIRWVRRSRTARAPARRRRSTNNAARNAHAWTEPPSMDFGNATALDSSTLHRLFTRGLADWAVGQVRVRVRHTRSTAFSGTCIYADRKIYVNLGRRVRYPYSMKTNLAKVQSVGRMWKRELYRLEMADGYQLAIFIFMHELYHLLVYRSGRNTRQKESMCDRFAARHLVDHFGCAVTDGHGRPVPRSFWDFQDLEGFVAAARTARPASRAARTPVDRDDA